MDRRKFIRNSASFVTLPILFGGQTLTVMASGGISPGQTNGKVLVLIQLDGGNDGLNTLIPIDSYDNLVKTRPKVVIPENKILSLTEKQGLHPSLSEIKELYQEEKLLFIQNVGYPQPNLSHFRSKEIVLSASDSREVISSGWMGRYLEILHPSYPDGYPGSQNPHPLAITIGNSSSPTCQGDITNMSVVLKNLNTTYESPSDDTTFPDTPYGKELSFISQVMKSTEKYLEVISDSANLSQTLSPLWPENNALADKLKIVSRLIAGGLSTPFYIVNLGGFDTHASQVVDGARETGKHADLLKLLSKAASAFQDELRLQQKEEEVISLVYSEFGRRIASNNSFGTDHGEAYPMILFGKNVNPTVLGENPIIPAEVEKKTNVPMKIDFRSVYASLLNKWMGVEESDLPAILMKDFDLLPILKSSSTYSDKISDGKTIRLHVYPNPVFKNSEIRFVADGSRINIKLYSVDGREIKVILDKKIPAGYQSIPLHSEGLQQGQYLLVVTSKKERITANIMIM